MDFISVISYGKDEYTGIIQNADTTVTSMYDISLLTNNDEKRLFIKLAEKWFYESDRRIPINIYLKDEWPFDKTLRTFITKECEVIHGPQGPSLSALRVKKQRRTHIDLRLKNTATK